eukprot:9043911-Pyramimonas_sp.AAC.1
MYDPITNKVKPHIPEPVRPEVHKLSKRFEEQVEKRFRLDKNIQKTTEDIQPIETGGWPAGAKPFKVLSQPSLVR